MKGPNVDLDFYVNQKNWPTDLIAARTFAHAAIDKWNFKEKAPKFHNEVDKATTIKRIQEIIIYPMLSGEGLKVVK